MTRLTGGCACSAVRYELTDEPVFQLICHCVDCQKASGSAFAEALIVAADRLSMLGDEPKFYAVKAESGRTMKRGFCQTCGSPIMIRRPETPQVAFIQAGSLDDAKIFEPAAEVFACRAQPSISPVDGAARFDHGPPPDLVRSAIEEHFKKRS